MEKYRYFDPETVGLDFEGMLDDIRNAPEGSIILLHGGDVTLTATSCMLSSTAVGTVPRLCRLSAAGSCAMCSPRSDVVPAAAQETCGRESAGRSQPGSLTGQPHGRMSIGKPCLAGCAHNPTGIDPTAEQWEKIADLVQVRSGSAAAVAVSALSWMLYPLPAEVGARMKLPGAV